MPAIPYNPDIPKATDEPSASQPELLQNAQGINNWTNVDHYKFDENDAGKHRQVTLPVQSPAPIFGTGELGLYNFLAPISGQNELYVHKLNQTGATTSNIPFTASILSEGAIPPVNGTAGWTYLPSGILIQWAVDVGPYTGLSGLISYPKPFPNAIFAVVLSPVATQTTPPFTDVDFAVRLNQQSPNNFTAYFSSRTTTGPGTGRLNYIAIGY